jgi:sulfide:quinone oxidoreductase
VKHVVILGAGFAGLELATRLSESLADEVRATLIDQNDSFSFGFSKLDILFGRKATADVLLHYEDISKEGVEFRQEGVVSIDPEKTACDDGRRLVRRRHPCRCVGGGLRLRGDARI